ncbi:hypothetical protein [Vagococcus fluvialis]|uniref:hypothetical protein n=1 Tax=Vagococcus fluvialis TaxID=2738 RepID=UPI001D0AEE50|nr:hypothetical protein [Vagococcus fluvialis]UDM70166.1 hypothetical protein K5L00_08435 [Vagococcus fluvialis]UDM77585.1 hypothetical protein K5K98_03980 [Vagococcus fluvialis]UDM81855.1 hypothetical protein K5K96_10915 [Vagococcus fluvialis]
MKIEVTYFKQSGKYYMDEEFTIPEDKVKEFEGTKEPKELSLLTYHFRNWFEEEIQHDEFIAVVLVDYDFNPKQAEILGFPMMVMPTKKD